MPCANIAIRLAIAWMLYATSPTRLVLGPVKGNFVRLAACKWHISNVTAQAGAVCGRRRILAGFTVLASSLAIILLELSSRTSNAMVCASGREFCIAKITSRARLAVCGARAVSILARRAHLAMPNIRTPFVGIECALRALNATSRAYSTLITSLLATGTGGSTTCAEVAVRTVAACRKRRVAKTGLVFAGRALCAPSR